MPIFYVDDGGDNTDGSTWVKAYTTLLGGITAAAAGDTIYIGSSHSEQLAANTTYTGAGTIAAPLRIISADITSGEPPTTFQTMVGGTGTIDGKTGGAYDIIFAGHNIWNGLKFQAGDDVTFATPSTLNVFYNTLFSVDDDLVINCGNSADVGVHLFNCDYQQVTSGRLNVSGDFAWIGGTFSFSGGECASYLLQSTSFKPNCFYISDVDFQDLDAGDTLLRLASDSMSKVCIKRCKVPAALGALYSDTGLMDNTEVRLHSVSSSDIIYQFQENFYSGQINEDTSIYLNATYDGTNGYSAKMTSTAGAIEWLRPLRFKLAELWAPANPTLTVELVLDSATAINNDDVWLEIEYPDSTTGALGRIDVTSRATDVLDTPAALTSSSVSWTGTGGFTNEQKRKISEVLANGQAGVHTVWICLAKPSTTIYVDPKITVA